jgi:hypothetical protein
MAPAAANGDDLLGRAFGNPSRLTPIDRGRHMHSLLYDELARARVAELVAAERDHRVTTPPGLCAAKPSQRLTTPLHRLRASLART